MEGVASHVGSLASFIGSLTVVGGALLWMYNKFIGLPREKRKLEEEEKRTARMIETITRENQPLNASIEKLTNWLNESRADRENLNRMSGEHSKCLDQHEQRLDKHHTRLVILEAKNGLLKGDE